MVWRQVVDGEQVMKNVNVNVKQKRGEIRAMVLECVVVSGCKSIKDLFRLALRGRGGPALQGR